MIQWCWWTWFFYNSNFSYQCNHCWVYVQSTYTGTWWMCNSW